MSIKKQGRLTKLKNVKFLQRKDKGAKKDKKPINGGKNLLTLGIGAAAIAVITTAISLKIYHDTGDIYLDRSRPGFIDEGEKQEKDTNDNIFSDSGPLNAEDVEEYLRNFVEYKEKIRARSNDFSADSLSDRQLNIAPRDDAIPEPTEE